MVGGGEEKPLHLLDMVALYSKNPRDFNFRLSQGKICANSSRGAAYLGVALGPKKRKKYFNLCYCIASLEAEKKLGLICYCPLTEMTLWTRAVV